MCIFYLLTKKRLNRKRKWWAAEEIDKTVTCTLLTTYYYGFFTDCVNPTVNLAVSFTGQKRKEKHMVYDLNNCLQLKAEV